MNPMLTYEEYAKNQIKKSAELQIIKKNWHMFNFSQHKSYVNQ